VQTTAAKLLQAGERWPDNFMLGANVQQARAFVQVLSEMAETRASSARR